MNNKLHPDTSVLRLLYSALLYFSIPFVLLRLLLMASHHPAYLHRWRERFGFVSGTGRAGVIWIHAVSVGEVNATRPLFREMATNFPHLEFIMTTMTPTGADAVNQYYGDKVRHYYIPYDLPDAIKRFIRRVRPGLLIVMETEIWPNLFFHCSASNIPVIIANARMSEKSCRGYRRVGGLTRQALENTACVVAQGRADADRLVSLGAVEEKVVVAGNLKFDIEMPADITRRAAELRRQWAGQRPVWIAASTHAGEEDIILAAHARIIKQYPDCLLIIAPRHPQRFRMIAELSEKSGFSTIRKSTGLNADPQIQVCILDTLGELPLYYAISDLGFIGGSLVPVGGHNMLEPACLGLPVITGPYHHNFLEIASMLKHTGAAWVVQDMDQLVNQASLLLADKTLREQAGTAGKELVVRNRGSAGRLLDVLRPYLAAMQLPASMESNRAERYSNRSGQA